MKSDRENPYDSPMDVPSPGRPSFLLSVLSAVSVLAGMVFFFLVLFIGPFAWILRDGLGPDSTDSMGLQAITRMFWCFYWGPATLVMASICIVASLIRRRFTVSRR